VSRRGFAPYPTGGGLTFTLLYLLTTPPDPLSAGERTWHLDHSLLLRLSRWASPLNSCHKWGPMRGTTCLLNDLVVNCYIGCPTSVFITTSSGAYKPGSILVCTSDGFADNLYTWTDASSGAVLGVGSRITLTSSVFSLTCTATGNFSGPCSASLTIGNSQPSTTAPNTQREHSSLLGNVNILIVIGLYQYQYFHIAYLI